MTVERAFEAAKWIAAAFVMGIVAREEIQLVVGLGDQGADIFIHERCECHLGGQLLAGFTNQVL